MRKEMAKYLIIIDMQRDFVTGALGTAEARALTPSLCAYARQFDGKVFFTQDTHQEDYLSTQEGRLLPVKHCIEGSEGWRIVPELEDVFARADAVFCKPAFGSPELARELRRRFEAGEVDAVELAGVCTDICVVSNALLIKAFLPEVPVAVLSALCAGVTPEKHEAALETMRSCQIEVR